MRTIFLTTLLLGTSLSNLHSQSVEKLEFEVDTLGGRTLRHKDFERNVLLVDYWGTWCPPCRDAVPVLQSLYAKYKHHGLEIVGFSYESSSDKDPATKVRAFATEQRVTYPLALGTPALKRMVKGLRAYPTLLFFRRGLQFDHVEVGFDDARGHKMEDWIRSELGLPDLVRKPVANEASAEEVEEEVVQEEAAEESIDLPAGTVFQPGDGDTGFAFAVTGVDGETIDFAKLRGKPVVLAMTSTWEASAVATAMMLRKLYRSHGEQAHILAASLELPGSKKQRRERVIEFRKKHGLECPSFVAGVGFQKKVHLFSGMPMFLVFDKEGVLVMRESGIEADKEPEHQLDTIYEKITGQIGM